MTDIMTRLAALIDPAAIRAAGPSYLEEPRGRWQGKALGVAAPGTAEEVAAILRLCSETGTPVIPYVGGTGLVGGQLAEEGAAQLILSLERMRAIRSFDVEAGTMTVEAGVILQEIHATAEAQGWIFPLTLASQGSARLGGLLATNAGGVNVLRYGNARDLVLGVEAVLADGTVINTLSPLRKNNMGYDLRHLLIGSEGTLGVITAASLRLFPKPARQGAAMMVVPSPEAALTLFKMAQARAGDALSAFELISQQGLLFLDAMGTETRQPFDARPDWICLIDLGMGAGGDPEAALEALFADAFEAGLVSDGGDCAIGWSARRVLGAAREYPRGQPPDRRDLVPRYFGTRGACAALYRGGTRAHRRCGRVSAELLWPYGRRQSALQCFPDARQKQRRS